MVVFKNENVYMCTKNVWRSKAPATNDDVNKSLSGELYCGFIINFDRCNFKQFQ